ncbi:MAG TPA: T9SS type A sorting domain-containing protein [Puia sp.]|nr:T9SS type A sorting domain-containing protein [Puia sp.]
MRNRNHSFLFYFFIILLTYSLPSQGQSLDSSSFPVLWLRADKGQFTDTSWKDFTGNGYDGIGVFTRGLKNGALLNYNPALTFNGVDDSIRIPYNLDSLSEITIMAVFQAADTTEASVWGTGNALARKTLMTTRQVVGPGGKIDSITSAGKFAILGTVIQNWSADSTLSPTAYMMLGSTGQQVAFPAFKGKLAELLVFDRSLDALTQVQYETYLAIKYGIPLTKGNYVSAGTAVLWDADKNKDYNFRIAGLARENLLALNQKQSVSSFDTDSLLIISAGKLAVTNQANADSIVSGNYLVWGDNNKGLTTSRTSDGQLDVVNRKWLMAVSGADAVGVGTNLRFNLKQVPSFPNGYWLVSDAYGQANLSADSLTYIFPDSSSSDSVAYYSQVRWDKDRSGKDLFALVQARDLLLKLCVVDSPTCVQPQAGKARLEAISGVAPFAYRVINSNNETIDAGYLDESSRSKEIGNLAMGTYSIVLTDAKGNLSQRSLTMKVPQALALNVDLGESQVLPAGGQILLDASQNIAAGAAQSYQWQSNTGFHSTTPDISVREPGTYTVTVTSTAGCVFTDSVAITGAGQQQVVVYPSPSTDGNFTVSVSLPKAGDVSVFLYDLNGNKLQEMTGKNNTEHRFQGHLGTSGLYTVSVKTDKGIESKKLLVLQ